MSEMSKEQVADSACAEADDECVFDADDEHKWEIEPRPYSSDFDVFVTDDDQQARSAILAVAEMEWDACEPGEEGVIRIRHRMKQT